MLHVFINRIAADAAAYTNRCAAADYARKIESRYSEILRVLISTYFMNIIMEILEKLIFKTYSKFSFKIKDNYLAAV